jgi:hypothetical protein
VHSAFTNKARGCVSQDVEEKTKKKKRENEGEIEGVERGG